MFNLGTTRNSCGHNQIFAESLVSDHFVLGLLNNRWSADPRR